MARRGAESAVNLYAVIPSISRRESLTALVNVLANDGVHVIVVDTGYAEPLNFGGAWQSRITILEDKDEPKNISRWWNRGLTYADMTQWDSDECGKEYVVAVLNDDVVAPSGLVKGLADAIIRHDVVAAFPDVWGLGYDAVLHQPGPLRMSGYAFALRGSRNLRADESLLWWYGDNDIEWQALQSGGVALAGGLTIQHLYPSSTTVGELAEQAGRDGETFVKKWGRHP